MLEIEEYAIARIELTAIGIVVWIAVVVLIFPFNPRRELEKETRKSLAIMAVWVWGLRLRACQSVEAEKPQDERRREVEESLAEQVN